MAFVLSGRVPSLPPSMRVLPNRLEHNRQCLPDQTAYTAPHIHTHTRAHTHQGHTCSSMAAVGPGVAAANPFTRLTCCCQEPVQASTVLAFTMGNVLSPRPDCRYATVASACQTGVRWGEEGKWVKSPPSS
jgi:hypothetical protein